ncbi:MAG: hypothetical protein COT74_03055 [Bdellovibrionales bacterium CG10_big_fil_rev_8_21_14_0_10_45_34]|nr:MAG: hypothetical protein COT74_03055 [Bdellovibrionales bacterium CG10_big_fil_rev_8_21_14_0_10_45_34]
MTRFKNGLIVFLMALVVLPLSLNAQAPAEPPATEASGCTIEASMSGVIGPSTVELVKDVFVEVRKKNCSTVLFLMNTPGGLLDSTREIVELILNFEFPVLCLVAPEGAHAGSAGAIILQACHVNGALETTNLGAATPILATGQEMSEDLRKKMINDTTSWLDGLTSLRGRSQKFGRDIITEAKAVSAKDALKEGGLDFVSASINQFLEMAKGKKVVMTDRSTKSVTVGTIIKFESSLKHYLLSLFSDPQIAYLLFMGSLALLYFEITHPGTIVPGVLGGIGLILALVSFSKLAVWWGGVALIVLGLAFLVAEAFVPSFGILGVAGLVSFVIGGIYMFDPSISGGWAAMLKIVLPTALVAGGIMLAVAYLVVKAQKSSPKLSYDSMVGRRLKVWFVDPTGMRGQVQIEGEIWAFESSELVKKDDEIEIIEQSGLVLRVKRV